MDKTNERFDAMVKRLFGPGAELAGSIGSERKPGELRIVCGNLLLGRGPTFQAALQDAQRTAAKGNIAA